MLYSVLPGLSLCMTLLKSNRSGPMVNVATDTDQLGDTFEYASYLDAAITLLQVAKQKNSGSRRNADPEDISDKSDSGNIDSKADSYLRCPNRPIDCEELLIECGLTTSGIYRIWPRSRTDPGGDAGFDVYCDMDSDGGGWTVFQRRDDFGTNSDFFYKNWLSYKQGFGHLDFDFWLGNDEIFALSNQRRSMLRIDLFDFADNDGFATYDDFYIDDEKEGYKLHIGDYRGNIGDSFSGHNLCKFSTRDRDNDKNAAKHCAQQYKGGWWYNNCHTANLNGLYLRGTHDSYANGVNLHSWRGFGYSVKKTEMKLRSSSFQRSLQFKN